MADIFECDSCKEHKEPAEKRGSITLDAVGSQVMPSLNPRISLDLCNKCFQKYHDMFVQINPRLAPFRG